MPGDVGMLRGTRPYLSGVGGRTGAAAHRHTETARMPTASKVSPQETSQSAEQNVQRLIWILLEGHATRVAEATVAVARNMGMSDDELLNVRRGALLHDVGKLELPEQIIYSDGPLSDNERK